jgi:hypothetical protein
MEVEEAEDKVVLSPYSNISHWSQVFNTFFLRYSVIIRPDRMGGHFGLIYD